MTDARPASPRLHGHRSVTFRASAIDHNRTAPIIAGLADAIVAAALASSSTAAAAAAAAVSKL